MTEISGAELTIDLGAVQANYRTLQSHLAGAELAAVVKADAYGLGLGPVVRALTETGCETFFVATAAEAVQLRGSESDANIHVFNGPLPGEEAAFLEHALVPVLNSLEQVQNWSAYCTGIGAPGLADIQIDTGMSRLGLEAGDVARLAGSPELLQSITLDLALSHLACADQPDHAMNNEQLAAFEAGAGPIGAPRHSLASSSGIFLGTEYHFDMARAGAALFGLNPVPGNPNPMRQVIRIQGKILQVRSVDTHRSVGYGASHQATRSAKIATVAIGYGDGYLRALSNAGTVFIDSHEVPVVGRVSMDLTTLDVTDVPDGLLALGQPVDFAGPLNPVDRIAEQAGTIGYEILTSLGTRYQRHYVGGEGNSA
ncbi:MAG: alanine racemase [Rhodospirillaceae bacterium]|jgi:alanine racemase|nr:alanine racemase [Rhodospirillaceae bacterium]MBT4118857.1 alanine racemase [Rhodospirillaceae bacterium]MBT4718800.1 alanine racemase [Rhodospirillaceae bacterium]MBT4751734.1 alanine racemase [Rhodospirillaceae bacterium]MBT6290617.1 alanine racemase [Rhodospirillaceae bacterium]